MPDTDKPAAREGLATGSEVIAVLGAKVATGDAGIIPFAVLADVFTVLGSPTSGHALGMRRPPPEWPLRAFQAGHAGSIPVTRSTS